MKNILIILLLFSPPCQAQIPADKQLHIAGGFVVGSWGTWVGTVYYPDRPLKSASIGLGITLIATGGKELLDMGTGGHPELADIGYSIAGGFIGAGLVYLGMKLFKRKNSTFSYSIVHTPVSMHTKTFYIAISMTDSSVTLHKTKTSLANTIHVHRNTLRPLKDESVINNYRILLRKPL